MTKLCTCTDLPGVARGDSLEERQRPVAAQASNLRDCITHCPKLGGTLCSEEGLTGAEVPEEGALDDAIHDGGAEHLLGQLQQRICIVYQRLDLQCATHDL